MTKIKLEQPAPETSRSAITAHPWQESEPFACNERGVLAHRIKSMVTYKYHGRYRHQHAEYWCGNGAHGIEPVSDMGDRLMCVQCEARAVAAGKESSSDIVGRHVHVGRLMPVQLCCVEQKEAN